MKLSATVADLKFCLFSSYRAGKPPSGTHLDVLKDDKLIQKLMIDEKKCYLFGRNAQFCQFVLDHASCSRVHSALVYHKFLNIIYLVDLGNVSLLDRNSPLMEQLNFFQGVLMALSSDQFG